MVSMVLGTPMESRRSYSDNRWLGCTFKAMDLA